MEGKAGAGVMIVDKEDNKFLLVMRSDLVTWPGHWCWPGGMVDPGELPEEAARREAWEEAGINLNGVALKLIHHSDTSAPRFQFSTYVAVIPKQVEPRLNWESHGAIWCSLDDCPEPLLPGCAAVLQSKEIRARAMAHVRESRDR